MLLNLVSLIILYLTTWLILISLLTVNITPLKLLSYTYMIILLTPYAHKKILVPAFSIYRPPFNTTDHKILLIRLSSWFGIHGTALNWFRSYLSCRCFRVKCNNDFSSPYTCLCGVLKAQFLALYSLSRIQPHLVLLFHLFL